MIDLTFQHCKGWKVRAIWQYLLLGRASHLTTRKRGHYFWFQVCCECCLGSDDSLEQDAQHHAYIGLYYSFCGSIVHIVGCSVAFLASTLDTSSAPRCDNQSVSRYCLIRSSITLCENYCLRQKKRHDLNHRAATNVFGLEPAFML